MTRFRRKAALFAISGTGQRRCLGRSDSGGPTAGFVDSNRSRKNHPLAVARRPRLRLLLSQMRGGRGSAFARPLPPGPSDRLLRVFDVSELSLDGAPRPPSEAAPGGGSSPAEPASTP